MKSSSDWDKHIRDLDGAKRTYPFGLEIAVYSYKGSLFALLHKTKKPLQVELRCDQRLAKLLRDKYETVMPADKLDPKIWNSVVLSGQVSEDDVIGLIRHAYELAKQDSAI